MQLLWDRKVRQKRTVQLSVGLLKKLQTEGGFPELKVLKQRLRNVIQPEKDLGHSDAHLKAPTDATVALPSLPNGADNPLENGQVVGSVPDISSLQYVPPSSLEPPSDLICRRI